MSDAKAGPWVDKDRSQMDPLPLSNDYDTRPSTRDLIVEHRVAIEDMRQKLKDDPLFDPEKHDDLWLLRYILSHKTSTKAATAAKKFLVYRKVHGWDERDIRKDVPGIDCSVESVRKYFVIHEEHSMIFSHPDPDRGIVMFLTLKGLNQTAMTKIPDEEWPFGYFLEWMFQCLDSATRRTGRLTKGIRFLDLKGYSLSQNNRECINRNAKNARECQDHYPQMLASIYVVNVVPVLQACYRLLRPLLPKRFTEKLNAIAPHKKESERLLLLAHMNDKDLPVKFGGSHEAWPPSYVTGDKTPIDMEERNTEETTDHENDE
jgi:CRAL/TRIO domain